MSRQVRICLHFDKVPVFQSDVRVALQRREMANAVVHRHTGGKSDTCWGEKQSQVESSEALTRTAENTTDWGIKSHNMLTFLHVFFLLEDLASFCRDVGVSLFTQAEHGHSRHSCLDYRLQSLCVAGNKIKKNTVLSQVWLKTEDIYSCCLKKNQELNVVIKKNVSCSLICYFEYYKPITMLWPQK